MYLHCRHGFIEADAWDGQTVPLADHQADLDALIAAAGGAIVVRARRSDTIERIVEVLPRARAAGVMPQIAIYESPAGWDYEFRAYLTPIEWGSCLARIAIDLDYRNFKHTMQHENPREYPLALAIWQDAHRHVPRDIHAPGLSITFGEPDEDEDDEPRCSECERTADDVEMSDETDLCVECLEAEKRAARRMALLDEHDSRGDYEREQQQDRERGGVE